MGRRFVEQGRSGVGASRRVAAGRRQDAHGIGARGRTRGWAAACLCATLAAVAALMGCGESSSNTSSVAANTASTATTPTTPGASTATTPSKGAATTSTAARPPASKPKASTTQTTPQTTSTKASTTPVAKPAQPKPAPKREPTFGKIKLTSTAFTAGGPIPTKYTCDGANVSPPLQWSGVPSGTSEVFILAVDLSGSATGAEWAIAGISPSTTSIPEGHLPPGAVAGVNSSGKVGWGGICGAKGVQHHIGFLIYALNHKLGLQSGFNPLEVRKGLRGRLAGGLTLATYQRP